jgi:hypothetical protein
MTRRKIKGSGRERKAPRVYNFFMTCGIYLSHYMLVGSSKSDADDSDRVV